MIEWNEFHEICRGSMTSLPTRVNECATNLCDHLVCYGSVQEVKRCDVKYMWQQYLI